MRTIGTGIEGVKVRKRPKCNRSVTFGITALLLGAVATPLAAQPPAVHELRLSLYYFSGARWSGEEIAHAAQAAGRLLEQCGLRLSPAPPRALDVPRRFHFYSTPDSRELLRRLGPERPAVFFVEDSRNQPAYDAEAIGRANSGSRPELADTVWVTHGARDLPQALAHELLHVLADSGEHSEAPGNLMRAETSRDNVRLSAAQCERARLRGVQNGLLQEIRAAGR